MILILGLEKEQFRTDVGNQNKISLVQVSSCSDTRLIRDDSYTGPRERTV